MTKILCPPSQLPLGHTHFNTQLHDVTMKGSPCGNSTKATSHRKETRTNYRRQVPLNNTIRSCSLHFTSYCFNISSRTFLPIGEWVGSVGSTGKFAAILHVPGLGRTPADSMTASGLSLRLGHFSGAIALHFHVQHDHLEGCKSVEGSQLLSDVTRFFFCV